MNYFTKELDIFFNDNSKDLNKNILLYNKIYKYYKEQDLCSKHLDLLIIHTQNKLSNKDILISTLATFVIGVCTSALGYFIGKFDILSDFSIIESFIFSIFIFIIIGFLFYSSSKDFRKEYQNKLIYSITLKVLTDIRNNL